jgi:hypothetical protein
MPACVVCFLALLLTAPAWGKTVEPPQHPPAKAPGHPIIDVLFAYTPAARDAYKRHIEELMYNSVVKGNDEFRKAKVDAEFRLAAGLAVTYDETGRSLRTMRADLEKMEPVKQRRDQGYIPVVAMLVGDKQDCHDAEFDAGPENAFAVVSAGCPVSEGFLHAMNTLAGLGEHNPDGFAKVWGVRAGQIAGFRSRQRWKKIASQNPSSISCDTPQPSYVACFFTDRAGSFIEKLLLNGDSVRTSTWAEKTISPPPNCLTINPNRIDCFALDLEGRFIHGTGPSSPIWEELGGKFVPAPKCVSSGPTAIDCFLLTTNNMVQHRAWRGSSWGDWHNIQDGITSQLSCTLGVQHAIDCFARGKGGMWQLSWDGQKSGAEPRGGGLSSPPACVSQGPGRIDCVARGDNYGMNHIAANGGRWGGWTRVGSDTLASDISCVVPEPGRIDCFALLADKPGLHQAIWDRDRWLSDWVPLGGSFKAAPTCISSQPKYIACLERDADAVYYKYWNGNAWYPQTAEPAETKP